MQIIEDSSCWHNVGQCPDLEITVFFLLITESIHLIFHPFLPPPTLTDLELTMLSLLSIKHRFLLIVETTMRSKFKIQGSSNSDSDFH